MPSEIVGPPVVPCYVGWYFTVILGNGSVHALLPVRRAVGQVTNERRLADVWASGEYAEFRTAARSLPEEKRPPQDVRVRQLPASAAQRGASITSFTP